MVRGTFAVLLIALGAASAQSLGRFTFGVLLPAVRADLGVSNTVAGTLATFNVGAYLLGTLAVSAATARYRLLPVLRVGLALSASGMVLAAVSPNVYAVAAAMLLLGLGGAFTWIPSPVVAGDALRSERRSLAIGILGSGMGVGVVFGGQLSNWVRSNRGDEAWRDVYVIQSAISIVALVGIYLLIRHRQDKPTGGGGIGGFGALRRMRGWGPFTLAFALFGLMYLLVIAFLTVRLEDDSGWTPDEASLAFTVVGIAMVLGGPIFIVISTRFGVRQALIAAFAGWVVATVSILPGWYAPTLVASAGIGLFFSGMPTLFALYVVKNTTAADYGPAFAAATLAFGVTQMVSPQLGGLMADLTGSFLIVFASSAVLSLLGLFTLLRVPNDGQARRPAPSWRDDLVFAVEPADEGPPMADATQH